MRIPSEKRIIGDEFEKEIKRRKPKIRKRVGNTLKLIIMGKVFQLRAKVNINSRISKGFVFNCPSTQQNTPMDSEIKKALEAIGGKEAAMDACLSKCEILR